MFGIMPFAAESHHFRRHLTHARRPAVKRLLLIFLPLVGFFCLPYAIRHKPAISQAASQTIFCPIVFHELTASPAPEVHIAPMCSQFDAPGDDRQNLNEEYVCFQNGGDEAIRMTGWRVADEAGATYSFPVFELASKATVRLHTGSGSDTATDLYWGLSRPVWNNDGDTIYLYDASGRLVERHTYP